ncbi:MAG: hypothetical protein JW943_07435 [Deltaproteobacteria bacterium]|nr:hypothetical protein [Deltaproteobacteria bacterium]
MNFGEKTISAIGDQVTGLLAYHKSDLMEAWIKANDEALSISLSVRVTPNGSGNVVKTDISFVKEKVKDSSTRTVSDIQGELDFDNRVKNYSSYYFDFRTRCHVEWMTGGGTKSNNPDFEEYFAILWESKG